MGVGPTLQQIATETGFDLDTVAKAAVALNGEYIELSQNFGGAWNWRADRVYSSAREAVGQWPTAEDYASRLLQALDAAVEAAPEGSEKRSKAKAAANAVRNMGRDMVVEISAAVISRQMGGG
jgi:hypothetical protein